MVLNSNPSNAIDSGESSPSLHERLRKRRISSGADLDLLAEQTKIQRRFFEAIEQGQLHHLPSGLYMRNFIRIYLEAIGIDDVGEVEEILGEITNGYLKSSFSVSRVMYSGRRYKSRSRSIFFLILASLLLVALGGSLWLYFHPPRPWGLDTDEPRFAEASSPSTSSTRDPDEHPQDLASSDRPAREEDEAARNETEETAATLAPIESQAEAVAEATPETSPEDTAEGVEWILYAEDEVWLRLKGRSGWSQDIWLKKGDRKVLRLTEPTSLSVGNAGALRMSFDGQFGPSLGKAGEVRRLEIDPASLSDYLAPGVEPTPR